MKLPSWVGQAVSRLLYFLGRVGVGRGFWRHSGEKDLPPWPCCLMSVLTWGCDVIRYGCVPPHRTSAWLKNAPIPPSGGGTQPIPPALQIYSIYIYIYIQYIYLCLFDYSLWVFFLSRSILMYVFHILFQAWVVFNIFNLNHLFGGPADKVFPEQSCWNWIEFH